MGADVDGGGVDCDCDCDCGGFGGRGPSQVDLCAGTMDGLLHTCWRSQTSPERQSMDESHDWLN